jgi:CubicO group peptidase (beta-lactamase class C family)
MSFQKKLLLALFVYLSFLACKPVEETQHKKEIDQLDKNMAAWLKEFNIPGAALAIIENGEVVLEKGYGFADLQNQVKVNSKTGFNIASISKTVTAWGVMKLVEEGKLELDESAESYLTRWKIPESKYDSKEVTIRRLLSHTAGLSLHGYAGFASADTLPSIEESLSGSTNGSGDVKIIEKPGTRYRYSGGGYTILQLIVEEVTGRNFEEYMQQEILNPLGMTNSSFTIDEKILKNSSKEYNQFEREIGFELFTAKAAAGLHTTIEDFSKFALASIDTNNSYQNILSASTLKLMNTFAPSSQNRYGLGHSLENFNGNAVQLSGHGGSNAGWQSQLQFNRATGDAFLLLTNSGGGRDLIRQAHCEWMDWSQNVWMGNRCTKTITTLLFNTFKNKGIEATVAAFNEVKKTEPKTYNYRENDLNLFGYELLWNGNIKESIKVFEMIIEEYPYSFNAYDSYGEALLADGQQEKGIKNYTLSLQMNPKNNHAKEILEKVGIEVNSIKPFATEEEMKKLAGLYTSNEESGHEWNVHLEFSYGGLLLKDRGMNTALVPLGNNKFVNPRQGGPHDNGLLVFRQKANNEVDLEMYNKYSLSKIDENLIETKKTWGQEIFVFPLNFAKDINYNGFEDVRFPRGWVNPDTITFWSYAGAWSINREDVFSINELNAVWKLYFDGLMSDVNKIEEAELEKTVATFEKKQQIKSSTFFTGELTIVNAFGTNELLHLKAKIEQRICPTSKRSYVLFKFSPSSFNEVIWKELDNITLADRLCKKDH